MKHYWSNKKCLNCSQPFIDKSHAQKAKACSIKCKEAYYYIVNRLKLKEYSRSYKANPKRKEIEQQINHQFYINNKERVAEVASIWTKNNRPIKNAAPPKRKPSTRFISHAGFVLFQN